MKTKVIYHGGGCADGFCSAWLFSKAFPDAEFVPAQYGEPAPDVTGCKVYLVDFSYPHDVIKKMIADTGRNFVCLDHHRTAEKELAGLEGHYVYDATKSGARLAWEFLYDNARFPPAFTNGFSRECAPWLVSYVEDRDLWNWSLFESKKVNAALRSYPLDFPTWDMLHTRSQWALAPEGEGILRDQWRTVQQHVRNAVEIDLAGHRVLCVNATVLMSEIGEQLAEGRPFGVTYFDRGDGFRVFSLRSRGEQGADVSEVAKLFGGGGHRNAAGFQLKDWSAVGGCRVAGFPVKGAA